MWVQCWATIWNMHWLMLSRAASKLIFQQMQSAGSEPFSDPCRIVQELACAEEAANDAAGVASAAADASDSIVAELRAELAEAKRRQKEAAAKVRSIVR